MRRASGDHAGSSTLALGPPSHAFHVFEPSASVMYRSVAPYWLSPPWNAIRPSGDHDGALTAAAGGAPVNDSGVGEPFTAEASIVSSCCERDMTSVLPSGDQSGDTS